MAQQNGSDHPIPFANYQEPTRQTQPAPPHNAYPQNTASDYPFTHAPQTRSAPMRLNLPPPPVFATTTSDEFPNQYGPSTLLYSPYGEVPPINNQQAPHQPYAPPYESGGYQAPGPTSPYPTSHPSGHHYGPGPLQQQQRQPQQPPPQPLPPQQLQAQLSPYYTSYTQTHLFTTSSTGSNESAQRSEYFPPFPTGAQPQQQQYQHPPPETQLQQPQAHPPFISPPITASSWQPEASGSTLMPPGVGAEPASAGESSHSAGSGNGPKTSRQQFTACGACRHRRVKCDLKDRQEAFERVEAEENAQRGVGPAKSSSATKMGKIVCSNCHERGMNCVDEYAPMKAAKQLRRGKRISEIESRYGRNAVELATGTAGSPDESKPTIKATIPELSPEFFESPFFRRFQVQRPILDPTDFVARYLSFAEPCAANLGPEGALLCHVLYAWATSYGVDEHGELDIPEGGGEPIEGISLLEPGPAEVKREQDRKTRFDRMRVAVEIILEEIDACGILRKPTWDGVRVLLLLLPLTESISSQVERLAMYESALSQVFMLCSYDALGYDGQAAGTSGVNGGTDDGAGRDINIIRIRTYWYAFVHEGITTGLKGGRLLLDGDDLETIQDSISNRTLVSASQNFRSVSKMAVAPINLALACRSIHRALIGPAARRRTVVNAEHVKEAWEALEGCWEEFESIRNIAPGQYSSHDEVIRFVDGWKIFLFEAQNVIRKNLEERLATLINTQTTAQISDLNARPQHNGHDSQILNVMHLLEIAKGKCDVMTKQILVIIRQHLGTRFFEWDASLVRDGTYYAAMLLAKHNGSDDDIACCVQALNELRWAHAKAWSRSADLRREWSTRSTHSSIEQSIMGFDSQSQSLLDALTSMSATNSEFTQSVPAMTRHDPLANRSHGTDSSLDNSPYNSSPSLISPVYDPNVGPPMPYGAQSNPHNLRVQTQGVNEEYMWGTTSSMPPPSNTGPVEYGQPRYDYQTFPQQIPQVHQQYQGSANVMSFQGGQNLSYMPQVQQGPQGPQAPQGPSGRYVFQPDGTQLYIPYSQN